MTFREADWEGLRTIDGLCRLAGVKLDAIPRLVAKEIADNALDAAGECRIGNVGDSAFYVEDDGPGLPGDLAALFSIARPLLSTKRWRLPTRGALGNGIRVVASAVLVTGGSLVVECHGRRVRVQPLGDGSVDVEHLGQGRTNGTRVEVRLGGALRDRVDLSWASRAVAMGGKVPTLRSSPHWYDARDFHALCRSAQDVTVREFVGLLDGCSGKKAGRITADLVQRPAASLTLDEATWLLERAKSEAKGVSHRRLGTVGRRPTLPKTYDKINGILAVHGGDTQVPVVIEVWGRPSGGRSRLLLHVNRTPSITDINVFRVRDDRSSVLLEGCGIDLPARIGTRDVEFWVNVQTPYVALVSTGKAPNLAPFGALIVQGLEKVARRVGRSARRNDQTQVMSQKEVILANLEEARLKASGDGKYRYSLRQLYYAVRPYVIDTLSQDLSYDHFGKVVTGVELEQGADLDGMYRDARGVVYHPHLGEELPLGTLTAESYERPQLAFNKVLYCEKEGFISILRAAGWPERHDCALMSSKGFASRAARDVIDLLGASDEEITVFCVHDADGAGTLIHQALQEGTLARPHRKATVINLGLDPREALAMGLEVEKVRPKSTIPVASYIDDEMREWLQTQRVELNAMTTPQFIAWLDEKLEEFVGKVIPPPNELAERVHSEVRKGIEEWIRNWILEEGDFQARVEEATTRIAGAVRPHLDELTNQVVGHLQMNPEEQWRQALDGTVKLVLREMEMGEE